MIPLAPEAAEHVLGWEDGSRRALALNHALLHRRPGLWGDHARRPTSVVLVREADGECEAFAAGDPEPAVGWLARRSGPVALLAPEGWAEAVEAAVGPVERGWVRVRFLPEGARPPAPPRGRPAIATRALTRADLPGFVAAAPGWAWRGWGSPGACLEQGAAVGVPYAGGFAALAWVQEQDRVLDAVGVHTVARYRRLGLGRAAATALVDRVLAHRRKCPLWATSADNAASLALARALGFTLELDEPILCWGGAGPGP